MILETSPIRPEPSLTVDIAHSGIFEEVDEGINVRPLKKV
jgi:hypothetical protein